MKLEMPPTTPRHIRPSTPTVVLTNEAYDALLDLSCKHNVSMRQLASQIIVQASKDLEVIKK